METRSFSRSMLLMLSGPLIWVVHFLLVYGMTGIICARPAMQRNWLGVSILDWSIVGAAAIAIAGILTAHWHRWRRNCTSDEDGFLRTISLSLAALSIVAIIWETVPVLLGHRCG